MLDGTVAYWLAVLPYLDLFRLCCLTVMGLIHGYSWGKNVFWFL